MHGVFDELPNYCPRCGQRLQTEGMQAALDEATVVFYPIVSCKCGLRWGVCPVVIKAWTEIWIKKEERTI